MARHGMARRGRVRRGQARQGYGDMAQLVEQLSGRQQVGGSNPPISTLARPGGAGQGWAGQGLDFTVIYTTLTLIFPYGMLDVRVRGGVKMPLWIAIAIMCCGIASIVLIRHRQFVWATGACCLGIGLLVGNIYALGISITP